MAKPAELSVEWFLSPANNPLILAGDKVDGRTAVARRYRDKCASLVAHLGGSVSTLEAEAIKRTVALIMTCERHEAVLADGEDIDLNEYVRALNTLHRFLSMLGLRPRPVDVTNAPTLDAHTAALLGGDQ